MSWTANMDSKRAKQLTALMIGLALIIAAMTVLMSVADRNVESDPWDEVVPTQYIIYHNPNDDTTVTVGYQGEISCIFPHFVLFLL